MIPTRPRSPNVENGPINPAASGCFWVLYLDCEPRCTPFRENVYAWFLYGTFTRMYCRRYIIVWPSVGSSAKSKIPHTVPRILCKKLDDGILVLVYKHLLVKKNVCVAFHPNKRNNIVSMVLEGSDRHFTRQLSKTLYGIRSSLSVTPTYWTKLTSCKPKTSSASSTIYTQRGHPAVPVGTNVFRACRKTRVVVSRRSVAVIVRTPRCQISSVRSFWSLIYVSTPIRGDMKNIRPLYTHIGHIV